MMTDLTFSMIGEIKKHLDLDEYQAFLEIITKDKEIELETTIAKLVDADEFTNVTQSKSQIKKNL